MIHTIFFLLCVFLTNCASLQSWNPFAGSDEKERELRLAELEAKMANLSKKMISVEKRVFDLGHHVDDFQSADHKFYSFSKPSARSSDQSAAPPSTPSVGSQQKTSTLEAGISQFEKGDFYRAIQTLQGVEEAEAYYWTGLSYLELKSYAEAEESLMVFTEKDAEHPRFLRAQLYLAKAQEAQGKRMEAIQTLREIHESHEMYEEGQIAKTELARLGYEN